MRQPAKHIVIRDMKRGAVVVEYRGTKREKLRQSFTLVVSMMEERDLFGRNLDNPIDSTTLYCYNIDEKKWTHLDLSKMDSYTPPGKTGTVEDEQRRPNSISEEKIGDEERTGNRSPEETQRTEETQTDERGAESQGTRESRQGPSSERTSEE